MNYNSFKLLSGRSIPTERRLDFVHKKCDNMDSGFVYAKFRNGGFGIWYYFNDTEFYLNRERTRINEINELHTKNGLPVLFTDVNDFRKCFLEYDYYWNLRTEEQFIAEEAFARAGLSRFRPVDFDSIPTLWSQSLPKMEAKISEFVPERFNRDNGTYWTGETVNGKYNGKGKLYFSTGEIYEGELLNDLFHGDGVLIQHYMGTNNVLFWCAEWKNGKPFNGKGTYYMNGNSYTDITNPSLIVDMEFRDGKPWTGNVCCRELSEDWRGDSFWRRRYYKWENGDPVKEESDAEALERFMNQLTELEDL